MTYQDIYSFSLPMRDGTTLCLSALKGNVILIVNTALHSPFISFLPYLEQLFERYQKEGFVILDIPSNQFKEQNPESEEEIDAIRTKEYGLTFPRTIKSNVIGENALPLYSYLTEVKKFQEFDADCLLTPVLNSREIKKGPLWQKDNSIKENFTFFFIDRKGKVRKRLEATTSKQKIEKTLLSLLQEN